MGIHIGEITDPMRVVDFLRNVWIAQLFYTFAISTIKFSVLAFYWRLFSVKGRTTIYIVTAMAIAWCIAIVSMINKTDHCCTANVSSSSA